MDINALASEFGSAGVPPPVENGVDIHGLAAEFGSDKKANEIKKDNPDRARVIIATPKPPISNLSKEDSDTFNALPETPAGPNPRDAALAEGIRNYIPSIGIAIANNAKEGLATASEGLGDIVNKGNIGEGAKKVGLGSLQALTSIPSGLATEGVGKPVTQLTGNPDIGDRAAFVAGSAIPIVPGLGTISKLRPSNVALKDLTDMITNNGANPENLVPVVQGMKSNSRLGPADLNPAVLSATQKLFATEGDTAKNYLATTSANRMKSSANVVSDAYDASTGLPVNAVEKLKSLSEAAKKVGNDQINPAIANAKPVNLQGTLDYIDSQLKPGVTSKFSSDSTLPFPEVKQKLANFRKLLANDKEMRTGAADIHGLQAALRREAEARLNSTDGGQRQLGHALMNVRNKIVDDIDKASGGKYKPALANYRDEKNIAEAFNDAYSGVFSNSKKMENRPEFTKEWLDGLSPHELEAAKEGARLAIDTEIKSAKNAALKGMDLVKSDFNRQKLEMLFGKEEAGSLIQKLDDERKIANTHNKVIENSQTAQRISAESKVDLPKPTEKGSGLSRLATIASYVAPEAANYYGTGYAVPGLGLAASVGANAIGKGVTASKDAIKIALAKEKNAQLAKLALPTEGPSRDALIKSLEAAIPGPKQSIVRRGANSLSKLVAP